MAQEFMREREVRVIVYEKGESTPEELFEGLMLDSRRGDEVHKLENWGREGSTYLRRKLLGTRRRLL